MSCKTEKHLMTIGCLFWISVVTVSCRPEPTLTLQELTAPVTVAEAQKSLINQYVSTTGNLKAQQESSLRTEVEGRLRFADHPAGGRKVREGDKVTRGQLLMALSNDELTNAASAASAAVGSAEISYESAKKNHDRLRQLGDAVSKQDLDRAETEFKTAEKTLEKAKLERDNAQVQLAKTRITSPVDGILTKLARIAESDRVTPGTEVATVMDYNDSIMAEVNVSNTQIQLLKVGDPVEITNYAIKDRASPFISHIREISPTMDQATRSFLVKVGIENTEDLLKPGMFVKADIIVNSNRGETVVVPRNLVLTRNNKDVVFVVQEEKAVMREVRLGIQSKDVVEVLEGLTDGEKVVTEGHETLKDGAKVKVSK